MSDGPKPAAFALSFCFHAVLVTAAMLVSTDTPRNSNTAAHPFTGKVIWYRLNRTLPNVRPLDAQAAAVPPRAVHTFHQNLVACDKDLDTAPRKVWVREPPPAEPPKPKLDPLPNLLAVTPDVKPPARPLKQFQPPPPLANEPKRAAETLTPAAPEIALQQPTLHPRDLPLPLSFPRAVRSFVAPPSTSRAAATPAPEVTAPDATPQIAAAPALVIAGLNPADTMDIPKPPPPHDASFSAGPKPQPGTASSADRAVLSVPSLYVSGGPKDLTPLAATDAIPASRQNLMAAAHVAGSTRPAPPAFAPGAHNAPRVSSSPDPRLSGRMIYMMAIQMPNVTSFSGSWIVWFAEHEQSPGAPAAAMRAPEPVRKVDPRYIPAAANDRVEGIVRLAATIRKDGRVDAVELLKHLDDRLDQSATEALAKWLFEPAERDGTPVDVDAVFEIPFRLAPREAK